MATIRKSKIEKKNSAPKIPPKKKISKFGQMIGAYKGLIIEREDCWD